MSTKGGRLPYPGLRSFTREETDLFFGREGCVDDMVDRLAATRFLAVLGASGSGKSSLVKTGLLDALELGLLHKAGSHWLIAEFRPGDRPIFNMAESLLRATSPDPAKIPDEGDTKFLRAFLARGPRSVVEWCEADNLPPGANLLLLVDQFEELFRFGDYGEREEADAFVALLLESAKAPLETARIYVAITMRSEYLGAAALIDGLAEAINRGLYLTPRMDRDQVRDAIAGPAAVCGFSIEPALVNRLLNDLTSFAPWEDADSGNQLERLVRRADQLPLMQHVLNRLWSVAAARGGEGPVELRLEDYNAIGGLRGALAAHGREILDELLPEHQHVASVVFRALTTGASLAEAVRRPTEFGELVAIAGGDEIAVREVVEAFRAPGRNFLFPPRPASLRPATVIDISHESLIRQWPQFAGWMQQEIASAAAWRRLVDQAERHQRGEANLLSGLALASLANWWDTEHPSATWAKRYGGDFDQAAAFLAESRKAEEAQKNAEAEERRKKVQRRYAAFAATIAAIIPFTVFAAYSAFQQREAAREAELARDAAEAAQRETEQALQTADAERENAELERIAAEQARIVADEQRSAAVEARDEADAAREEAEAALNEADAAREAAELAGIAAQEAQQRAVAALADAEEARRQAEVERQRADQERASALLELAAGRVWSLQQNAEWDASADLLGEMWTNLIDGNEGFRESWMIEPVRDVFARQSLAEYPVVAEFLPYAGLEGWSGSAGRFRIFSRNTIAGETTGNRSISFFDAMTGAVTGSFDLPTGVDLGTELDLMRPDGLRAAIVTDEPRVALWAHDQPAPTFIPFPTDPDAVEGDVEIDVAHIAPVNTDARFVLALEKSAVPYGIMVVDPAAEGVTFEMKAIELADLIGSYPSLDKLQLLGLVGDRLFLFVNDPDGRIITLDVGTRAVSEIDIGGIVYGAQLTPDGRILLALACIGDCAEQDLVAIDLSNDTTVWVEKVHPLTQFSETAARIESSEDDVTHYSATVDRSGVATVFRFGDDMGPPNAADGDAAERFGEAAFVGNGTFRKVDPAPEVTEEGGVKPAGLLATYEIPEYRDKLSLYVSPNSVAIHQGEEGTRIAGVTYEGFLLAYRRNEDGSFAEDPDFPSIQIAHSNCIAAVAFGGGGRSLLIQHIDGALQYVAAAGKGAGTGWRGPDPASPADAVRFVAAEPATECELPDRTADTYITERIVPLDPDDLEFAVLDNVGLVRRIFVTGAHEAGDGQQVRDFAPPQEVGAGIRWIASDSERGHLALVSATSVEIEAREEDAATPDARPNAPAADAPPAAGSREQAAAPSTEVTDPALSPRQPDVAGPRTLPRRGEPRAAAFAPDGVISVVYADGQVASFRESDGIWSPVEMTNSEDGAATITTAPVTGMFATAEQIGVAQKLDRMIVVDRATGAIAGHAKIPAAPSVVALQPGGQVLSVEYDTDSVSDVALASLPAGDAIRDTAELVAMRSLGDPVVDSTIEALARDPDDGAATDGASALANEVDCAEDARRRIALAEARLLGETPLVEMFIPVGDCPQAGSSATDLVAAAESLAERAPSATIRKLIDDASFSVVLRAAASGDAAATRILGAALIRIAEARGGVDPSVVSEDALRFGTRLSASTLQAIAAGAPIRTSLVELAKMLDRADPAAHQLMAHALERRINDPVALSDALFHYAIAERLYREAERTAEIQFTGHRRAQLARMLPDARVLDVAARLDAWKPGIEPVAAVSEASEESTTPAGRNAADMKNVAALAERMPQSPLLDLLSVELERTLILNMAHLAGDDPKAATEMLLQFERRSGEAAGWSPDLVREYLALAGEFHDAGHSDSGLRLAAEAIRMIAASFPTPIHGNAEAVELFNEAAETLVATAAAAPADLVKAEVDGLALPFVDYEYGTLPAIGADVEISAAQLVLSDTARIAEAAAKAAADPAPWNHERGEALFWQGVLVNDVDPAGAVAILQQSAELLKPSATADGANLRDRFLYAEILRWVGLAEPSTEETAEIERDALDHYGAVWAERADLDTVFLQQVGVGYGFAIANLAQTIREVNLADIEDGRAAEDHAAWMLEALALAADLESLNSEMIRIGAATADSGFVGGWYRMSTYGWPLGFLGGLVNVESGADSPTPCDLAASDPYDPKRRAPGVFLDQIDLSAAETECAARLAEAPGDVRAKYELARIISWDHARASEYLPLAKEAAADGAAPAYALMAYAFDQDDDQRSDQAYDAASQQTIVESFPALFPFLETRAKTERDRAGLAWYSERAAALGVPEAHFSLAQKSTDKVTKTFHLRIAARLWDDAGDGAAAADAQRQLLATTLTPEETEAVETRVAEWAPEPLTVVPEDAGAS